MLVGMLTLASTCGDDLPALWVNAVLLIGVGGLGVWRLVVHDYVVGLVAVVVTVLCSVYLLARK